ncbi:MAG: hypothetical protein CMC79_05255 [Flavobacteriaceae bacterium]|nr:hypothetical protein [Flavobacteriaceae bacterium]
MKCLRFFFIVVLFFSSCNSNRNTESNFYSYVPQNTVAIVQINEGTTFKQTWSQNPSIRSLSPKNIKLESLFSLINDTSEVPELICFSSTGKNKFSFVLIQINNAEDNLKNKNQYNKYAGVEIKDFYVNEIAFYEARLGSAKIISPSKITIENIIRNYTNRQEGISGKDFYLIVKSLNQKSVFNILIKKDAKIFFNQFLPELDIIPSLYENWLAFDGNFNSSLLSLDGITITKDSIPNKLTLFNNLKPKAILSSRIIPKSFNSFMSLPVENMPLFADQLRQFSNYYNLPIKTKLIEGLNAIDEITFLNHNEGKSIILHRSNINQKIFSLSSSVNSYRNIEYGKLEFSPKELSPLLDIFNYSFEAKFLALIEDFYVMSDNLTLTKTIINNFKDGATLKDDKNFLNLQNNLSDINSGLWVSKTRKFDSKINNSFSPKDFNSEKFPLIGIQWVNDVEISHVHLRFGKNQPNNIKNTVTNEGSIVSESSIINGPLWLKNHRSKEYDIVFQDENNYLYLFSNSGTLYWKKKLTGRIIGEIQQVDLYKNKRLQMAFRTSNHFIILDRNGKIVKPFNININSYNEIQPLSVFDYDGNRNYRFLLSQDNNLLMLNSKGENVNGFRYTKTSSPLLYPPKHIRFKDKDFIIIQQQDGKVLILNRRGKEIIKLDSTISFSNNPIWPYLNTFSTSDNEGNLIQIDIKGNIIKSPEGWANQHLLDMTTKSLVSISENILTIKGIPIKLPYGNYTRPKIFYINNTLYITITDKEGEKVYLFYSNGNAVPGFPVYGSGPAQLENSDNDKALELITKSESNGIIIYKLN